MNLLKAAKWPLTVLVSIALILGGTILIGGEALGIPEATQNAVLEWAGGIGAILAVLLTILLTYLSRDSDGDGTPDVFDDETPPRGRGSSALLLLFVTGVSAPSAGCASWLDVAVPIAQAAHTAQVEAEPVIRQMRLEAAEAAIREAHAAGAPRTEAVAAMNQVHRDWRCAIDGHRLYGTLVSAYIEALWLASETDEEPTGGDGDGDVSLEDFFPFIRRLADGYRAIASCVNTLEPGQLPAPAFLDLLPSGWEASRG